MDLENRSTWSIKPQAN